MIHHSSTAFASNGAEAGRQVAQLRHVQALAEEIAGRSASNANALDEMARIGRAYEAAAPMVQRQFDDFAAETAHWAASGVEVLIATGNPAQRASAAARRLADELAQAIAKLGRILS